MDEPSIPLPDDFSRFRVLAFDSGIGGLGIVAALRHRLPGARIDYLADNALFPYGEQEDETLIRHIVALLTDAVRRLNPDVVVVACNTASTLALTSLRAACPTVPFVGCVPPIRWAARLSQTRVIGLLATRATVRRPYVAALREQYAPDCVLIAHGARHLADMAERTFRGEAADPAVISRELRGLFEQPNGDRIDAVGIGCTHYTFLLDALRQAAPPDVAWLDPADAVARRTATVLTTERGADDAKPERAEDEGGPGGAWFTAPPERPSSLTRGLADCGYAAPEIWPAQTPSVRSQSA
ncbi:glutamate racemase [Acetobacter nitrogenifigens DSM 23921 = NBRC 105050]|uniref:Glutamate racemase n=1 Tax=Acetobacter nitrogenifigens DSM 23921 = NBRC 105050 TaxID=1120919 RepID=A0A511X6M8_9PROT|nr:aspartate/glutamate racemase family protein [Acetobacter nitrogenifigens]GBQ98966.1 glutamate racemase [Acetobacter nitrogenifigens DSM 23921 = NBRC 105050]GEN58590.1 glutamate racemase [Acetobacter nitrogenifigens DSM 23921 = NBRC 105050]